MRQQILVLVGVFVIFFSTHSVSLAETCSELASHIDDIYAPTLGVDETTINLKLAEKFCSVELAQDPANANTIFNVSRIHFLKSENQRGVDVLQKASAKKYPFAQYLMGFLYLNGLYIQKDTNKALDLLDQAQSQGISLAKLELGKALLQSGKNVDQERGISLLREAAFAGVHQASFRLGEYFEKIKSDTEKALKWYSRGSEAGNIFAILRLAKIYSIGLGVPSNKKKTNQLYLAAAKLGHSNSQVIVGLRYLNGSFGSVSKDLAKYWLYMAKKNGNKKANEMIIKFRIGK